MKTSIKYVFSIILLLFLYLLFWPVPINPKPWHPPKAPELQGVYKANDLLSKLEIIYPGQCDACEDVAIDSSGSIYGAQEDGKIMLFKKASKQGEVFADTKGRPLGLHFDKNHNLIVADAYKGLLSISPDGKIWELTKDFDKKNFGFTDDLEIADDGIIYFSDASNKFSVGDYKSDILEHGANGAFYSYNPKTGETKKIIDKMYFANGIAVSHNQDFVLVNETSSYRIRRYWIKGPKAGTNDIFMENLPGFNDGISQGKDGIFWIALITPRNALLDNMMTSPFQRKLTARLPEFLKPKPENFGFILGVDKTGKVIYNLQDPSGKFAQISSVQQFGDSLYLGSLGYSGVGVYSLKNIP